MSAPIQSSSGSSGTSHSKKRKPTTEKESQKTTKLFNTASKPGNGPDKASVSLKGNATAAAEVMAAAILSTLASTPLAPDADKADHVVRAVLNPGSESTLTHLGKPPLKYPKPVHAATASGADGASGARLPPPIPLQPSASAAAAGVAANPPSPAPMKFVKFKDWYQLPEEMLGYDIRYQCKSLAPKTYSQKKLGYVLSLNYVLEDKVTKKTAFKSVKISIATHMIDSHVIYDSVTGPKTMSQAFVDTFTPVLKEHIKKQASAVRSITLSPDLGSSTAAVPMGPPASRPPQRRTTASASGSGSGSLGSQPPPQKIPYPKPSFVPPPTSSASASGSGSGSLLPLAIPQQTPHPQPPLAAPPPSGATDESFNYTYQLTTDIGGYEVTYTCINTFHELNLIKQGDDYFLSIAYLLRHKKYDETIGDAFRLKTNHSTIINHLKPSVTGNVIALSTAFAVIIAPFVKQHVESQIAEWQLDKTTLIGCPYPYLYCPVIKGLPTNILFGQITATAQGGYASEVMIIHSQNIINIIGGKNVPLAFSPIWNRLFANHLELQTAIPNIMMYKVMHQLCDS